MKEVSRHLSAARSIWVSARQAAFPAVSVSLYVLLALSLKRITPSPFLRLSQIPKRSFSCRLHRQYVPLSANASVCPSARMLRAKWLQLSENSALIRYLIPISLLTLLSWKKPTNSSKDFRMAESFLLSHHAHPAG